MCVCVCVYPKSASVLETASIVLRPETTNQSVFFAANYICNMHVFSCNKLMSSRLLEYNNLQVIQFVTFLFPSWRSRFAFPKGSRELTIPKRSPAELPGWDFCPSQTAPGWHRCPCSMGHLRCWCHALGCEAGQSASTWLVARRSGVFGLFCRKKT